MYQVGTRVIYGTHGVCRVVRQDERKIDRKMVTYLVLEPEGQPGSQYLVPAHNQAALAKLRPMIGREELESLFGLPEVLNSPWIPEENLRKQTYREILAGGDRKALMQMVHRLYTHREAMFAHGRKFHLSDENFLRDGEKLLTSEVAAVLGLSLEEARAYIREKLKADPIV